MSFEIAKEILLWCLLINYGMLVVWFLVFKIARNMMYELHGRWFKLSNEEFDSIHYKGMAFYKIGVLLFNLSPYLALVASGY